MHGWVGPLARRDADVAGEGAGVLLLDGRDSRLPAEASEHLAARCRRVGHEVGAPRDAVAVVVVRIGEVEDVVFRHGLEQSDAEHRGRDPRGQEQALDGLAVGPDHLVVRLDQGVGRAVLVLARPPRPR